MMRELIDKHNLNRVVVASCTPRTHEPLFKETLREAGLNKYLFEMANIRDQCSWVHMHEPERATEKAKDLVRMAVAKARLIQPLTYLSLPVNKNAIVIGGGVAGMVSALDLAEQGFKTHLIERKDYLGGHALKLYSTYRGDKIKPYVEDLIKRVSEHQLIDLHLGTTVKDAGGFVGNFTSTLIDKEGKETKLDHGAIIIATGGESYKPKEYLYGEDPNVFLSLELDQEIMKDSDKVKNLKTAVFIQCVGSRIPERPYCSKVCCTHSIHSALTLKELNPDMDAYILYRDIRTFGEREELYLEARSKGVLFIRFDLDNLPQVEKVDGRLKVTVTDPVLGIPYEIHPDIITLATAIVPREDNDVLSKLYKVSMNQEGFFLEAHLKLRPVDFATEGIYLAGLAHYPKPTEQCIAQAKAAAARAATVLSRPEIALESTISYIVDENCDGCAYCVETCPFGGLWLIEYMKDGTVKKTIENNPSLCKGCGSCQATCPKRGVFIYGFTLDQLTAQVEAALGIA